MEVRTMFRMAWLKITDFFLTLIFFPIWKILRFTPLKTFELTQIAPLSQVHRRAKYALVFPKRVSFLFSVLVIYLLNRLWKESFDATEGWELVGLRLLGSFVVICILLFPLIIRISKKIFGEKTAENYKEGWINYVYITTLVSVVIGGIISPMRLWLAILIVIVTMIIGQFFFVQYKRITKKVIINTMPHYSLLWLLVFIPAATWIIQQYF